MTNKLLYRLGEGPWSEGEQIELYAWLGAPLRRVLISLFDLPEEEAERLVGEMFIHCSVFDLRPENPRVWLIGAACAAARQYRERQGLSVRRDAAAEAHAMNVMLYQDALALFPARTRDALRLHYWERRSYAEVAAELGMTPAEAEELITTAWATLRGSLQP